MLLLTAVHTTASHARLSTLTRCTTLLTGRTFRLRVAAATGPWISVEASHALTHGQVFTVDDALGVDAAEDVGTGGNASLD